MLCHGMDSYHESVQWIHYPEKEAMLHSAFVFTKKHRNILMGNGKKHEVLQVLKNRGFFFVIILIDNLVYRCQVLLC